jgi:FAD/FMN-containing dehydrogenase
MFYETYYIDEILKEVRELLPKAFNQQMYTTKNNFQEDIGMPNITNYTYNEDTAVTTIEWSDGTKTTVRAENPDTADQHTGFMAAYAKKAAGNNNTINNLYDEWAVKKPAREMKAQIEANAVALEEQRIAKKRKAKKEKWLIRKRAAEIAKEYEARKIANEKYGVPMDYKAGDNN